MSCPIFNEKYFCIVSYNKPELAMVISSYLNNTGQYLPMFVFPSISVEKQENNVDYFDAHTPGRYRAEDISTLIRNNLRRISSFEYLILGGLTDQQKSYLSFYLDHNTIDIETIDDVEILLDGVNPIKNNYLNVREDELLKGLHIASRANLKLKINNDARNLDSWDQGSEGLILIEDHSFAYKVIAVNYALSINASIEIVKPFSDIKRNEVQELIEIWKEDKANPNVSAYQDISALIYNRIENIDFKAFNYVTFFTEGIPYSLIIKNIVPSSYVDLLNRPDFFVFNCIYFEKRNHTSSAIVFSPLEFGVDEETNKVIDILENKNFYVKKLVGKSATTYNLEMGIREFPYDILHICSHGGEVEGYKRTVKFKDKKDKEHEVIFHEVLSFSGSSREELIKVNHKQFWKYFNGFKWLSEELKEQNYPNDVYAEMVNAVKAENNKNKKYDGIPIGVIKNSCHIKCNNFYFQAMFNSMSAANNSPIIFNNTCWSANMIKDPFIDSGARGYIGTLWNIDNSRAKIAAEAMYNKIFDSTILDAFQECLKFVSQNNDKDVYAYWGLHFSTIKEGNGIEDSKNRVKNILIRSLNRWKYYEKNTLDQKLKDEYKRLANWVYSELLEYFT